MKRLLITLLLAAFCGSAGAQSSSRIIREYAVPSHGKFVLEVPEAWRETAAAVEEPPSVHLQILAAEADRFKVRATAIWLDPDGLAKSTSTDLRQTLNETAQTLLPEAVESEAELKELKGDQTTGYYFGLTDREFPAGEYRYMIQGIQLTGELLTVYTILYHDWDLPEKQAILDMFAGARHAP